MTCPTKAQSRPRSYVLFWVAVPAILAILASLWPLERTAIILLCTALGLGTLIFMLSARTLQHLLAGMTTLAILMSVGSSNWPLRAAYTLSRPSFDRVAAQIRAGDLPQTPCAIGLFRIQKVELSRHGIVCLWTNDAASGATGFVQTEADDLPFNLWSHTRLDDAWQFISED